MICQTSTTTPISTPALTPKAVTPMLSLYTVMKGRGSARDRGSGRELVEKKRKDYAFRRQFNETRQLIAGTIHILVGCMYERMLGYTLIHQTGYCCSCLQAALMPHLECLLLHLGSPQYAPRVTPVCKVMGIHLPRMTCTCSKLGTCLNLQQAKSAVYMY